MTTEKRETLYARIAAGLVKNHDERIGVCPPEICLGLSGHNLPLPRHLPAIADEEPGRIFVDEITAAEEDARNGCGVQLCFSRPYPDGSGCERIDTMDIEDVDDELLARICRIAEDPAYLVGETYFMPGIETVHDSMQLDSGQEIANVMGEYHGHRFEVSVRVCGSVRVIFRDRTYKCASRMPKELLDCYARNAGQDGIRAVAESDGGDYETPYYCDMNNWLEEVVFIDGEETATNVIDAPDDNSAEGWKDALLADALEAVDYVESDGDEDDRDDAGIFDLPDGDGGVPYRVLIVRGEDLDGTPDTLANVLELMRDNLNADGRTNHHVERFGTAAEKEAFLKGLRYDSVSYDNFLVLTDEDDIGTVVAEYGEESVRKPVD